MTVSVVSLLITEEVTFSLFAPEEVTVSVVLGRPQPSQSVIVLSSREWSLSNTITST